MIDRAYTKLPRNELDAMKDKYNNDKMQLAYDKMQLAYESTVLKVAGGPCKIFQMKI